MNTIKILLLIAAAGHILCGFCDLLLTYVPGGKKFDVKAMSDNGKMAEVFGSMPLKNPLMSMLLGCLALFMCSAGYYGLYLWMKEYSEVTAVVMLVSVALFLIFGVAHHVLCGVSEWMYIRMGMTEEARSAVVKLFKDTSITMIACYLGWAVFGIALLVAVVTGRTDLPAWACVFNIVPLFIVTIPLRVGGMGNWCGAAMFLGLMIMI